MPGSKRDRTCHTQLAYIYVSFDEILNLTCLKWFFCYYYCCQEIACQPYWVQYIIVYVVINSQEKRQTNV